MQVRPLQTKRENRGMDCRFSPIENPVVYFGDESLPASVRPDRQVPIIGRPVFILRYVGSGIRTVQKHRMMKVSSA